MILGKYLILKDKQFYESGQVPRIIGPAVQTAKRLLSKFHFLHIVDLDLNKGLPKNLDVYDDLTYFIHVQVEIWRETALDKLLELQVRPVAIPGVFRKPEKYKAIRIFKAEELKLVEYFRDVVVQNEQFLPKLRGKRVFMFGKICEECFASIL